MSQDDATNRARDVIDAYVAGKYLMPTGYGIERVLAENGLSIIDTRTHAAIPREPSEADVERVARAMCMLDRNCEHPCKQLCPTCGAQARAAIAALVGEKTQGGEREDV